MYIRKGHVFPVPSISVCDLLKSDKNRQGKMCFKLLMIFFSSWIEELCLFGFFSRATKLAKNGENT